LTHSRQGADWKDVNVSRQSLRKKLHRQAKKAQRRKLTAAIEARGHHHAELGSAMQHVSR
jgi:hypothetical protein